MKSPSPFLSEVPPLRRNKRTRNAIPKSVRFEVFKRDKFTCQYCGSKAPDVLLQLDHLHPHSKGGDDSLLNLVTSCEGCNAGKSDRVLSEDSALAKQRGQLAALEARREQLTMMYEWQKGLLGLEVQAEDSLCEYWTQCAAGYFLNERGRVGLRKLTRVYRIEEVMVAMKTAAGQYLEYKDGEPTAKSVEKAWKMVGGICRMKRLDADDPGLRELFYVRGILRNRLAYLDHHKALVMLKDARAAGANTEDLSEIAKACRNWTDFQERIHRLVAEPETAI